MPTPQQVLQQAVDQALLSFEISGAPADALQVVPTANAQFGDYQFNGALPLAKILKQNPRALATQIVAALQVDDISAPPEIAGPGFINFRLKADWLAAAAAVAIVDPRHGVPLTEHPRKALVDYPSPNVAKPLHVGHIRPAFIGEAISRLLRFAGHEVVTDNHIGDWGTPIGKVIVGWRKYRDEAAFARSPLDEMGRLYKLVHEEGLADPAKLNEARATTAALQSGDPDTLAVWETLRAASQVELDALYQRIGVQTDVTLGESFYNTMLEPVVEDLIATGIARQSEGAIIIPFEEPPHLRDKPMLVRKSDGSALYATTDLATVKYRIERWDLDEMIYVVDARQSDHFRQLFAAVKLWGYDVAMHHIAFGTILGEDGRPIKSKDGSPPLLNGLLDEAAIQEIARIVGVGAIKYADLAPNRTSDYLFSWDKMLALTGNTAPYLQYAYVRTRSLRREAARRAIAWPAEPLLVLEAPAELGLAKHCLQFGEVIAAALADYRPHVLGEYLFELAGKYSTFWHDCPVLTSESPLRESRMWLGQFTGDILQCGLGLLGIETIEQM